MKTQLLLPMFAALCFTGLANSQPPEQPHRRPEPPRDSPETRRPQPGVLRPEARRDEGRRPELREEMRRRFEARVNGPHDPQGPRHPEFRRPPGGDHPQSRGHSPGFHPVPPEIQELRDQVSRLTREVEELRRFVHARHDSRGGPGPESHRTHASRGDGATYSQGQPHHQDRPNPPGGPASRADGAPFSQGQPQHHNNRNHGGNPPGDGPRSPDVHEPRGNPPPR